MSEDLTAIRSDVLDRLKLQRATVLDDLTKRPGDVAARARLKDLENCIAVLYSALGVKPGQQ